MTMIIKTSWCWWYKSLLWNTCISDMHISIKNRGVPFSQKRLIAVLRDTILLISIHFGYWVEAFKPLTMRLVLKTTKIVQPRTEMKKFGWSTKVIEKNLRTIIPMYHHHHAHYIMISNTVVIQNNLESLSMFKQKQIKCCIW